MKIIRVRNSRCVSAFIRKILFISLIVLCLNSTSQDLQESLLPISVLETFGQSVPSSHEERLSASFKIVYHEDGTINKIRDREYDFKGFIGVKRIESGMLHNVFADFDFETRSNFGEPIEHPVLGMPMEEDWVLFTLHHDFSLIRNPLFYNLWDTLGYWAPRVRFTELVFNNMYQGVYLISETVKRDTFRLDIAGLNEQDTVGRDLTGGYILKIKCGADSLGFVSRFWGQSGENSWIVEYPKPDKIHPVQQYAIREFINTFEGVVLGDIVGLQLSDYVDIKSFVDYMLITELSGNYLGYVHDSYFYKDKRRSNGGGELVAGPVWNFNYSVGNTAMGLGENTEGWVFSQIYPDSVHVPSFWGALFSNEDFHSSLKCRYTELRESVFDTVYINSFIDTSLLKLNGAATRHNEWLGLNDSLYSWGTHANGGFEYEVQFVKDWLSNRLKWMDSQLLGCSQAEVKPMSGSFLSVRLEGSSLLISSQIPMEQVSVFSSSGVEYIHRSARATEISCQLPSSLCAGVYFIKVLFTNGTFKTKPVYIP